MEKNQLMALALCMVVLLAYPWLLKRFYPPAEKTPAVETTLAAGADESVPETKEPVVSASVPARPAIERPAAPEVFHFENELYDAEMTRMGGSLMRLAYRGDAGTRERTQTVFLNASPEMPGLLAVGFAGDAGDLSRAAFSMTRQTEDSVEFAHERAGEFRVVKRFFFSRKEPIINLEIEIQNLASYERTFTPEILLAMHDDPTRHAAPHEFQAVAWTDKATTADAKKIHKKGFSISEPITWAGIVKKYFCILIKPDDRAMAFNAREDEATLFGELRLEPVTVSAGASRMLQNFVYAGPQRYEALTAYQVGFVNILSRGFFGGFKILFLRALKFSHRHTGNFGWDILLLTLLIKLLFAPLTHMSYKSMAKMKAIQPKLQVLQERHKDDPSKLNREMMELYKKHRVNPMGGCLPMLLQIPVFIAFYQVLNEAVELRGAPFIGWITDLSEPDHLFMLKASFPLIGNSFNLLPLLMTVSMVVQQRMTPQSGVTPEQQKMFAFMPLIFCFVFYNMPSGLVLYWLLNNVLSIVQQGLVKPAVSAMHHDESA